MALYIAALGIGQLSSIRLFETEKDLLAAQIARLGDPIQTLEAQGAGAAWSGFRKFMLVGKVLEGDHICSFYFAPHDGQALPPFLPGQFLTFQMTPDGSDRSLIRCYSLSDSPTHPDYYRVTIKRIRGRANVAGSHDGVVSSQFHRTVMPDDLIDVKAPSGHFHLNVEERTPVVLTGGGIGLTPVLSMVNYLVASGSKREAWLFYGVAHGGEHVMKEHLASIAAEHENIHLHICYSAPRDTDRLGVDYDHAERVSVDLFKRLLPSNNYDFYTCGPAPMMDQITHELEKWGVPEDRIHFEAFGAATVKRVSKDVAPSASGPPIEVEFARSGNTLVWDNSSSSLLEFAEASGIAMDSGCRAGNCGACVTAVRSGNVQYLNPPGATVDEGSCLTCISVPKGNLVLDA
ncbi:MAG: ferredoxin-NADP reductase [Gammaproteobacteria bacterium]